MKRPYLLLLAALTAVALVLTGIGAYIKYVLLRPCEQYQDEKLIALPARLRDKTSVFSHIRVINGREYLVFRR